MIQQFHFWVVTLENKNLLWKVICTPMSTAALCTVAKKQGKHLSTDEKLKKMWRVYMCYSIHILTQRNIIQPQKKERNLAICNNMDLKGIMLCEINQTEKAKYCVMSLICAI